MTRTIDAARARRLAVKARVDPRTLLKVYRGEEVRGDARNRAMEVLVAEGLVKGATDGSDR